VNRPKFGIFDHIEDIPGTPTSQLFKERLELIKMADEAGFGGFHLAEHHGGELCMAPSQEVFIAAASQVTKNIHLGPMVKLLPMHSPVRLIEDICILDQLTEGRVEYGVGRGAVPIEHYWFGRDWPSSRDRFVDSLGIIQRALTTGEISSEGSRFYDFPTMPLATKPYQERVPFWYPGSPFTAGRHGMSLMWPGKINEEAYELYLDTWHSHKHADIRMDGPGDEPRVGYSMLLAIAPTESEARDIANMDIAVQFGAGTPGQIAERVAMLLDDGMCDYICFMFPAGDMTFAESRRTLELFVTEVQPQLEQQTTSTR
jgi:alkanesulfonate monooxygenase SsuD/methylene tetrahydromethanopterin reductase-like flavin-dependent oxidoreductase (luciferase family)